MQREGPSTIALCFVAGYLRLTLGEHARGETRGVQTGRPQRRAGLDIRLRTYERIEAFASRINRRFGLLS